MSYLVTQNDLSEIEKLQRDLKAIERTGNAQQVIETATGLVTLPDLVIREIPGGLINGTNRVFTLANNPQTNTEEVFLDGVRMKVGAGNDYTISGNAITFEYDVEVGQVLAINYIK